MDVGILAGREQIARRRVVELAGQLADQAGVDPTLVEQLAQANHRDPRLRQLFQTEALVPLLEAVVGVNQAPAPALDRPAVAQLILTELPQLSKTAKEAITEWAGN
jgi:hypothetical protein